MPVTIVPSVLTNCPSNIFASDRICFQKKQGAVNHDTKKDSLNHQLKETAADFCAVLCDINGCGSEHALESAEASECGAGLVQTDWILLCSGFFGDALDGSHHRSSIVSGLFVFAGFFCDRTACCTFDRIMLWVLSGRFVAGAVQRKVCTIALHRIAALLCAAVSTDRDCSKGISADFRAVHKVWISGRSCGQYVSSVPVVLHPVCSSDGISNTFGTAVQSGLLWIDCGINGTLKSCSLFCGQVLILFLQNPIEHRILEECLLRRRQSALPIAVSYHPLRRLRRHNSDRSIYRKEEDWYQMDFQMKGMVPWVYSEAAMTEPAWVSQKMRRRKKAFFDIWRFLAESSGSCWS